jgi:hypothetical protein
VVKKSDIDDFLKLREQILEAFEDACPNLNGRSWKMSVEDRRDMYWRLADKNESLVYAEDTCDVVGEIDEGTFVDTILFGAIWRPENEDFVVMLVNTGLGDPDVVVFLSSMMERALSAEVEKRQEQLSP